MKESKRFGLLMAVAFSSVSAVAIWQAALGEHH
jgi:hypothetical protein